jgi:hypothetical protein
LKDGLALGRSSGTNPFKLGFIGSTDTHSATPGGTMEDDYKGHLGRRDAGYRNVQDHFQDNPGGHAVVWAEENSRDAIFEGIRRKETYATSGTRLVVRFFGGWDYAPESCDAGEVARAGYDGGVPMGGDLPQASGDGPPRFVVSALKDPGSEGRPGTDLAAIQIVKGWLAADGTTRERVFDVVGDATRRSPVDRETCRPAPGEAGLCAVWTDPEFDPAEPAFYYARVLENPTCRWSTLQCRAAGVDPFASDCRAQARAATERVALAGGRGDVYGSCCLAEAEEPFYSPVVQERAWTSPIWYAAP